MVIDGTLSEVDGAAVTLKVRPCHLKIRTVARGIRNGRISDLAVGGRGLGGRSDRVGLVVDAMDTTVRGTGSMDIEGSAVRVSASESMVLSSGASEGGIVIATDLSLIHI